MTARQQNQRLSEIAGKPAFRIIDGVQPLATERVAMPTTEADTINADLLAFLHA